MASLSMRAVRNLLTIIINPGKGQKKEFSNFQMFYLRTQAISGSLKKEKNNNKKLSIQKLQKPCVLFSIRK